MNGAEAALLRPPDWNPYEHVVCSACGGWGRRDTLKRGQVVVAVCRACRGRKRVLRGEPPDSPFILILDYTRPETTE